MSEKIFPEKNLSGKICFPKQIFPEMSENFFVRNKIVPEKTKPV